jgi:hypothetical protein
VDMANERQLLELLGRALADEEFRALLFDDPRSAARQMGCELTDEQVAALKASDLQSVAEGLDERLVKKLKFGPL